MLVALWITIHYITIWVCMRSEKQAGGGGGEELEKLRSTAERLQQRLDSIETILDHEAPNWRQK